MGVPIIKLVTDLQPFIGDGLRPFVCRGMPELCTVMIVGKNAGTPMGKDWRGWWDDETGFDFNSFMSTYRKSKMLAPGDSLAGARLRMEWLHDDHHLLCLETNVYSDEGPTGYKPTRLNMKLVRLLIARLPLLKAVVIHGEKAKKLMRPEISSFPAGVKPLLKKHLSLMSNDEVADLAAEIKRL